jgi:hypothetical protein
LTPPTLFEDGFMTNADLTTLSLFGDGLMAADEAFPVDFAGFLILVARQRQDEGCECEGEEEIYLWSQRFDITDAYDLECAIL